MAGMCSVSGCEKPAKQKQMCWGHYCSDRRYGDAKYASLEARQVRRFWNNVEKTDGCWNWTGLTFDSKMPYGRIYFNSKENTAHRVSWEINNKQDPGDSLVLHHCDNPRCVNPKHLYLGTYFDNAQDRERRNRRRVVKGEEIKNSKLTEESVLSIRRSKESCTTLGKHFNVSRSLISLVRLNKVWTHVKENSL